MNLVSTQSSPLLEMGLTTENVTIHNLLSCRPLSKFSHSPHCFSNHTSVSFSAPMESDHWGGTELVSIYPLVLG